MTKQNALEINKRAALPDDGDARKNGCLPVMEEFRTQRRGRPFWTGATPRVENRILKKSPFGPYLGYQTDKLVAEGATGQRLVR